MDRIRIVGGNKLNGTIPISGAKNAALPLMIAALLTEETLILDNVPRLADVAQLQRILGNHGVDIMSAGKRPGDHEYQGQTLHISAANIIDTTAPYELVSKMRASFWVIAPLLARMHRGQGFAARRMRHRHPSSRSPDHGAGKTRRRYCDRRRLCDREGARRHERRRGRFPQGDRERHPCRADGGDAGEGHHRYHNAACEPEIADVADCLNKMGAQISGAGTPRIVIEGVGKLAAHGTPCCPTGSRPAPMRWRWR